MDKHYGWQDDRGSQSAGRFQNGQRWNERNRDDDRDMRGSRGGENAGWDQNEGRNGGREQRWGSSGADFDRGGSRPFRGQSGNQDFSGGHYGGFANEGSSRQGEYGGRAAWNQAGFGNEGFSGGGNYGGNRGFSNHGYSGQGFGRPSGQGFAGRGPKGYQRSDERLKEQVSDRLMDDDGIDASEITIEVKNGEVTLTGTVNSRQEKRAAEDAAEQTPGVREVQNLLRVQSRESSSGGSASGQFGSTQSKSKNTERE